ncbi:amidohydrolase family protein [Microbaculum marinum]|uniref:Amidohydrolase family protein n=1 Tax=Microbaculum marinum TaxID=1764581 RepID=A0AAW9RVR7_9HYPH
MEDDEPPLVDAHLHVWTRDLPLTDTAWHRPPTDASVEQCLETLDAHGVVFAVIAAASLHGEYNDHVRRALKAHPRLRATATLAPRTDIYQMEQMKADGFVGVRLMWALSDEAPDIDTGDYRMFLRRIADLGWHVHLVEKADRTARAIAAVEASGARLVIDHMAGFFDDPEGVNGEGFKAVLAAVERGNTWVKMSCRFRFAPPETADPYAEALLRVAGPERLMWGSDWPFADFEGRVTYGDVLADLKHLVPDLAVRRKITGETPLRFYFT